MIVLQIEHHYPLLQHQHRYPAPQNLDKTGRTDTTWKNTKSPKSEQSLKSSISHYNTTKTSLNCIIIFSKKENVLRQIWAALEIRNYKAYLNGIPYLLKNSSSLSNCCLNKNTPLYSIMAWFPEMGDVVSRP